MTVRPAMLTLCVPALVACQSPAGESPPLPDYSDGLDEADVTAILQMCGAPPNMLQMDADGFVLFNPDLNLEQVDYDVSVCVIEQIRESGTEKFGFIGNERYQTPESE